MVHPNQSPLDSGELKDRAVAAETSKHQRIAFYLELIPISIIAIGVSLQYFGKDYGMEAIILGGGLAAFIYLFFSWYLFKVDKYKHFEVVLSIITGLLFPIGIAGLVLKMKLYAFADQMINFALYGGIGICAVSLVFLAININKERESNFYKGLLARVLILTVILLRTYAFW